MRAQAAIFECFISILLLYSAISMLGYESYASIQTMNQRKTELLSTTYDFQNFLYENSDIGSCAYPSTTCAEVLRTFAHVYALSYANFSYGNSEYSYGNPSACVSSVRFCAPFDAAGNYLVACSNFCGG